MKAAVGPVLSGSSGGPRYWKPLLRLQSQQPRVCVSQLPSAHQLLSSEDPCDSLQPLRIIPHLQIPNSVSAAKSLLHIRQHSQVLWVRTKLFSVLSQVRGNGGFSLQTETQRRVNRPSLGNQETQA